MPKPGWSGLRDCFPNSTTSKQQDIRERAEWLLATRNRITHHEPLVFSPNGIQLHDVDAIRRLYVEAIAAISWMCLHTADFADERSNLNEVLQGFEEFIKSSHEIHTRGISKPWRRHPATLRIMIGVLKSYYADAKIGLLEIKNLKDTSYIRMSDDVFGVACSEDYSLGEYVKANGLPFGMKFEITYTITAGLRIAKSMRRISKFGENESLGLPEIGKPGLA